MIGLALIVVYFVVTVWFAANAVGNAEAIYELGEEEYGLPRWHVTLTIVLTVLLWPISLIVAAYGKWRGMY